MVTVILCDHEKTKINEKEAGIAPFKKQISMVFDPGTNLSHLIALSSFLKMISAVLGFLLNFSVVIG